MLRGSDMSIQRVPRPGSAGSISNTMEMLGPDAKPLAIITNGRPTTPQKSAQKRVVRAAAAPSPIPIKNEDAAHGAAPVELVTEFLGAVMAKEYDKAQELCLEVLKYEPHNKMVLQYKAVLSERVKLDAEMAAAEGEDESGESDSDGDSDSSYESNDDSSSGSEEDSDLSSESDESVGAEGERAPSAGKDDVAGVTKGVKSVRIAD